MSFTKQDILTSIKNLDVFLKIPELQGAKAKFNPNGSLFVFSGGFNMVFQLEHQNKKWAFRVWHVPMGDNKQRYLDISKYLQKTKLPYFVDFIYDENGLSVNGQLVDTIRMEWIEASVLKDYLEKHLKNKAQLEKLANNFLEMIKSLHKNQISHGDLQHGNILIEDSGSIKLVDYDSICTPDIEGKKELVTGLRGYQHPSRFQSQKASLKADYFSELIIYLSILGLANKPELWDKYKVKDTEYLLFADDDFKDIEKSAIYLDLKDLSPQIDALLNVLKRFLQTPSYLDLKPFYDSIIILPIIHHFHLFQNIIPIGNEIQLEWKVDNAKTIEILFDGNSIDVTNKTNFKHKPQQNTTYTLKAFASDNKTFVEEKINVTVIQKTEILEFIANKTKLLEGEELQLSWKLKNTSEIELYDPDNKKIPVSYGFAGKIPNGNRTNPKGGYYRLVAKNQFFRTEKRVEIKVYPQPQVVSFVASPTKIGIGSITKIEWEIQNAHSVKLLSNGNSLKDSLKSSYTDSPNQDTTYTLEIIALDEQTVFKEKIDVKVIPKSVIKSFYSNTKLTLETMPIRFYWDIEHASSVKIFSPDGQEKDVTHLTEIELPAQKSGKYILKVQNEFFKDEATIYLHVEELPKIELSVPSIHNLQLPTLDMNINHLENSTFHTIENEFEELVSTPRKNTLGWLNFVKKLLNI